MIKNDLVAALSGMDYYKNQAGAAINDVFCVIAEALANGESVTIRGFGTFEVKKRKGCLVRDIHTGDLKKMDDYKVVAFRPGNNLRDAVRENNPEKLRLFYRAGKNK